jgi:large subunit ribosomal protein L21
MFAIIRTGGKQFKITEDMKLRVPTLHCKVGEEYTFREVLLLSTGDKRYTGAPTIKGAYAKAEILGHGRDDKQVIFKYKRRKGYQQKQGHRQGYTEVHIKSIGIREKEEPVEVTTQLGHEGEEADSGTSAEE